MKRGRGVAMFILAAIIIGSCLSAKVVFPSEIRVGGLLELYQWPEETVNLVQNSSFEQVEGTGQVTGWEINLLAHLFSTTDAAQFGMRSLNLKDSHLAI